MICLQAFDSTMTSDRKVASIESAIYLIRGQRVMFDSDLAAIYGVTTKRLNEQVRRDISRFPEDFAFKISAEELLRLRSQFATSKKRRAACYDTTKRSNIKPQTSNIS
jgi:hypothetical protein